MSKSTDRTTIDPPVNERRDQPTTRECAAMRTLARDGWTVGELRMTMHVCRNATVRHHVTGACGHQHDRAPIRDWDGDGS